MYIFRVAGEMAGEARDVARARTPTHGRLRDRLLAIAVATVGLVVMKRGEELDTAARPA